MRYSSCLLAVHILYSHMYVAHSVTYQSPHCIEHTVRAVSAQRKKEEGSSGAGTLHGVSPACRSAT